MRANLMMLLAAFIWGTAFVAQAVGMEEIGPFTYGMGRYLLGTVFLILFWLWYRKRQKGRHRSGFGVGLIVGLAMFVASALQQVSLLYTTAGKTAFLTCLYIVFVPMIAVFLKHRIRPENWLGAVLGIVGLYFLCVKEDLVFNFGDILAFLCSIGWAVHILLIDHYVEKHDAIEISVAQCFMCLVLNTAVAFTVETVALTPILNMFWPIFYAGIMSSGVAFTLQILAQKEAEPAHIALIMSLEAVFGAVSGWVILGEIMTTSEIIGCVLVLVATLTTQSRLIFGKLLR